MLRLTLASLIGLALVVGGLLAAEGVVVKFDKGTLTVKMGDKEKTYKVEKGTHVHDVDGKELKGKAVAKKLKKGTKIDIEEKDGKIEEINIKK
jgi:hypothetical protein